MLFHGLGCVDRVQNQPVNRALAEVLGDFRPRVVRPERFLVDVLFKDVAEHVGIDFVVLAARRVVQIPRVAVEQRKQVVEGLIGNLDLRIVLFDTVREEQTAVEVFDFAEQFFRLGRAFAFRLGEAFKEQRLEELGVVAVLAALLRLSQLVAEVVQVPVINKSFLLQEVDKHQPVEQDRGVPAPLPLVADTANQFQERDVLFLKLAEEFLGDSLNIERRPQPAGDLDDADVAVLVKLAQVEHDLAELAEKQITRLSFAEQVIARVELSVLAFDPIPKALCSLTVHEDEQVLVVQFCDFLMNGSASLGIWNVTFDGLNLEHD